MATTSDTLAPTSPALLSTPLESRHVALGAKMGPFAGYNMPISYAGIKQEHHAVRQKVGVFDVSHMGEFVVKGDGALALLQRTTTNDVSKLSDGQVQYSCLPNGQGGIVDDLLVYRIAEGEYFLVVNASNKDKDFAWLQKQNEEGNFGAMLEDVSDHFALLAVQGPKAAEALQSLTELPLADMKYYTFGTGTFAGLPGIIVSATGYTGAGGFELYIPAEHAEAVWDAVFAAGAAHGMEPAGLGARDTLRLEMGYALYGNDIDDTTSPIEAGLGWITKFADGKDFINRAEFEAHKANGVTRKLVGIKLLERGIARQHTPVVHPESGEVIGEVTSGTESPTLSAPVAMAYVAAELAKVGSHVAVEIRGKRIPAEVVKTPFLTPEQASQK